MPIKTRELRELGRALVTGSAEELTEALDAAIEPKGLMWERISDVVIAWVVQPIIAGRAEVIAGIRDALEQVDK
jgi:phosphate/sulfate permease